METFERGFVTVVFRYSTMVESKDKLYDWGWHNKGIYSMAGRIKNMIMLAECFTSWGKMSRDINRNSI